MSHVTIWRTCPIARESLPCGVSSGEDREFVAEYDFDADEEDFDDVSEALGPVGLVLATWYEAGRNSFTARFRGECYLAEVSSDYTVYLGSRALSDHASFTAALDAYRKVAHRNGAHVRSARADVDFDGFTEDQRAQLDAVHGEAMRGAA